MYLILDDKSIPRKSSPSNEIRNKKWPPRSKSSHTQLMNSFSQPINQNSEPGSLHHTQKHFSVLLTLYFAQGLCYHLVISLIHNHLQYTLVLFKISVSFNDTASEHILLSRYLIRKLRSDLFFRSKKACEYCVGQEVTRAWLQLSSKGLFPLRGKTVQRELRHSVIAAWTWIYKALGSQIQEC